MVPDRSFGSDDRQTAIPALAQRALDPHFRRPAFNRMAALATRLREVCQADATIARFGGDELVVWSPKLHADRTSLHQALRGSPIVPSGTTDRRTSVRCSIGAVRIQPGESPAGAVKRADEVMYVAKNEVGDPLHIA